MSAASRAMEAERATQAEAKAAAAVAAERAAARAAALSLKKRAASKAEGLIMLYGPHHVPPPAKTPEALLDDIARRTRMDGWGSVPLLFGVAVSDVTGAKGTPAAAAHAVLRNESEELIALVKSGDAAAVGLALPTKQRPVYDPHPKVHADTVRREPDAHCRNSARINWRDAHGFTALHWACQRGHARIALRLVQLGACENGRFAGGTTPLQIAHMHGRAKGLEVQIRRLVDQRAAIDRRLHVAASRGKTDEVLALLRGNHPLSSCAELEVAQIGADPVICASVNAAEPQTRRSGGGETALHDAASFGHNSTVAALLRSGAWVDARDGLGWTALHRACAVSPPVASTARLLIAAATLAIELGALDGAVLPGGDVSGTRGAALAAAGVAPTRAEEAVAEAVTPVAEEAAASKKGEAKEGSNVAEADPLPAAAEPAPAPAALSDPLSIARRSALLAFVDAKTRLGETALQMACSQCAPLPFVRYLIEIGASPTAHDSQGMTALQCVCASASDPLLKNLPLALARYVIDLPGVLPQIDAKVYGTNETALHICARSGHLKLAQFMVKKGCNTFARNSRNQTPLMVATAWMEREGRVRDEEHDHQLLINWLEMM